MSELGPISTALEADLRSKVQQNGIVVWLDRDGTYTHFVDQFQQARAERKLPYAVHAFRGSQLALMLELESVATASDPPPLLIHLPGFTEDTVKTTPLLGLYRAGTRYRKALDTLIREAAAGTVPPEQINRYLETHPTSLDAADAWLLSEQTSDGNTFETSLRSLSPAGLLDDLLSKGPIARQLTSPNAFGSVQQAMAAAIGLPSGWPHLSESLSTAQLSVEELAFALSSWAFAVEYVDDLKRPPVGDRLQTAVNLPSKVISSCRDVAAHLRERHAPFYQRTADETEDLLAEEKQIARAEDLGKIDTFRFEEEKVLRAALDALASKDFQQAQFWAAQRLVEAQANGSRRPVSFWLQQDPSREFSWQLVDAAARLGMAITASGSLDHASNLQGAITAYEQRGAAVDQAHRHLEQRRLAVLFPQLPEFDRLLKELDSLRGLWRQWADAWALAFNQICRSQGFLPPPTLQQRTLFQDDVLPFTKENGKTALFMVDALRYEMAAELFQQLENTPSSTVQLKARLAELPTVTEVGMNVLAPVVSSGRLMPALSSNDGGSIQGFSTGEFRVNNPETRQRAMHERVGGGTCPWLRLDEVMTSSSETLKRKIANARLVVVHSREIDDAGEKGVGLDVFDRVLQTLKGAWQRLRSAGVRRFVITADHGFLLNEGSPPAVRVHGGKLFPSRRHVFRPHEANHDGEVRVSLSDLNYQGVDAQLMMPEDTAVFDTGKRDHRFVHGGNSLQERVIPVLTLVHRSPAGGSSQHFKVLATAEDGVAGLHCLKIQVVAAAQLALEFGSSRRVALALRIPDHPELQVELAQARGSAQLSGSVVQATVGESFELFFRLTGPSDEKVRVEVFHFSATDEVAPCIPESRFAVSALSVGAVRATPGPVPTEPEKTLTAPEDAPAWLLELPEGSGIRQFFAHLAAHGAITDPEVAAMLGSPRAARRFALQVDELAKQAPFAIRIDVVAGVKRYVKEVG